MTVVDIINQNNQAIKMHTRKSIACALNNGRLLTEKKAEIAHGSWLKWIANTNYTSVSKAQQHMRLWKTWKPYIDNLLQLGIIEYDNFEEKFVDSLDDNNLEIALSCLQSLTSSNTPDLSLGLAIKVLNKENILQRDTSTLIIEIAKIIDECSSDLDKQILESFVVNHGVRSPEVIASINQILKHRPELVKEWELNGFIHIISQVGREGYSIHISKASVTDIKLALGDMELQKSFSQYEKLEEWRRNKGEKKIGTISGKRQSIIEQLSSIIDEDSEYRVVIIQTNLAPKLEEITYAIA